MEQDLRKEKKLNH
jgi:hypothetical protein